MYCAKYIGIIAQLILQDFRTKWMDGWMVDGEMMDDRWIDRQT